MRKQIQWDGELEIPALLGQKHLVKVIPEVTEYPTKTVPIVEETGRQGLFIVRCSLHLTRKR